MKTLRPSMLISANAALLSALLAFGYVNGPPAHAADKEAGKAAEKDNDTPVADAVADLGIVKCANLIYGQNKTSECFSDEFLVQIQKDTNVRTHRRFFPVKLDSSELYDYPFSVMTGSGTWSLTPEQRENMRQYLMHGGFIVASAGCSDPEWNTSFKAEMKAMFPDVEMKTLAGDHPVFHTVYDIATSRYKSGDVKLPDLWGLEMDGRIVMIWSPDGLNDTANAGPGCCCCGGNEIKSARQINVNLLAYALTH